MGAALLILMAAISAEPPEFDAFFKEFTAKRAGIQVLEAEIVERPPSTRRSRARQRPRGLQVLNYG